MGTPVTVGPDYFSTAANSSLGSPSGSASWGSSAASAANAPDGVYASVHLNPNGYNSPPGSQSYVSQWLQTTDWQGTSTGAGPDWQFLSANVAFFARAGASANFGYQVQLLYDGNPVGDVKTGTFALTTTGAWTADVGNRLSIGDWGWQGTGDNLASMGVQIALTNSDTGDGQDPAIDSVRMTADFGFYDAGGGVGSQALIYGRTTTRYIDPRRGRNRKTALVTRRPTSELIRDFRRRIREAA